MRFDFGAIESYILGGIIYSSLSAYILFFFNKKDVRASRLLALGLLGTTWYCFIFLMTRLGWILKFTWLYGYGIPIYYTVPVFFYWYVHRYTNPKEGSHRRNYWHFLPSLISFIALIPFYLSSSSVKLGVINEMVLDLGKIMTVKVGWIPLSWHLSIRPVQAGVYLWFQWNLLLRATEERRASDEGRATNDKKGDTVLSAPLRKWLICFTLLETLIYLSLAVTTIIGVRHVALGWEALTVARWPYVIGILLYLLTGLFLFIHPEILYGKAWLGGRRPEASVVPISLAVATPVSSLVTAPMSSLIAAPISSPPTTSPVAAPVSPVSSPVAVPVSPVSSPFAAPLSAPTHAVGPSHTEIPAVQDASLPDDEELSRCALLLKEYVHANQLYLRPKLTLHLLASELAISPRMVSSVLNKYYKQRFTEYINTCRIEYIISRLEKPGWQELTLEGLAKEAGFSSKSTFFAAFKKVTSVSPGEYLDRIGATKKAIIS